MKLILVGLMTGKVQRSFNLNSYFPHSQQRRPTREEIDLTDATNILNTYANI